MKWLDAAPCSPAFRYHLSSRSCQAANWQPDAHEVDLKCTRASAPDDASPHQTPTGALLQRPRSCFLQGSPWHPPRNLPGLFGPRCIYYVRQIRQEARQNYAEVLTLERTLEIHRRNLVRDVPRPIEHLAAAEHAPSNEITLIPPWIGNGEDPAGRISSEKLQEFTGET